MPFYQFRCDECGAENDRLWRYSNDLDRGEPCGCGSEMKRVFDLSQGQVVVPVSFKRHAYDGISRTALKEAMGGGPWEKLRPGFGRP